MPSKNSSSTARRNCHLHAWPKVLQKAASVVDLPRASNNAVALSSSCDIAIIGVERWVPGATQAMHVTGVARYERSAREETDGRNVEKASGRRNGSTCCFLLAFLQKPWLDDLLREEHNRCGISAKS